MNPPVIGGRRRKPADVHALGIALDLLDQREEPEKVSGAHVTAVVDHEHLGEARARRVATDAVAEREGQRVPDQRSIVGDGVRQHPLGMAGQPEHRPIAVGILVVGAQLQGVLLLRKVARGLTAHVNADAGIERGAADDAVGARRRLQHLQRRRDVFGPVGLERPRLERVNQDDRQVAREALRVRVHAQVDLGGDRSLLRRVGHDGDCAEARRRVEGHGAAIDGRHRGRQRAVERVVDVGPGMDPEADRFAADEGSCGRAEQHRQGVRLAGR
jgi:hypothetical protein